MTDMTAEQALEMLADMAHMEDEEYAKAGGGGRVESLQAIIRQSMAAPRLPEGWLVMRGKYGIIVQGPEGMITEQVRSSKQNLCFHDPVIYQFLESVLTAAPAPVDDVCKHCNGDGEYCLAGHSAHPANWHKCDVCLGTGKVPAPADSDNGAAMREASSLAMNIWKQHYKDVSPNFELCDSVVGILTQIDNMVAGLSEKIVERGFELAQLKEKYHELIMEVHEKIPGKSRHETALSRLRSWNAQQNTPESPSQFSSTGAGVVDHD